MEERASVPVRVRRVAGELRDLRREKGVAAEEVCRALGFNGPKLSRMENGQRGLHPLDVATLLGFYGVPNPRRQHLLDILDTSNDRNWWQTADAELPPEWDDYAYFEERAERIDNYENELVPGLLQIPDYTLALAKSCLPEIPPARIEALLAHRSERKMNWYRRQTPLLSVFLAEAALELPVGSASVMAAQLQHILDLMRSEYVRLQVVPRALGAHPAHDGPFAYLRFPDQPSLVHVGYYGGCAFLEEREHLVSVERAVRWLREHALSHEESRDVIARHAERFAEPGVCADGPEQCRGQVAEEFA